MLACTKQSVVVFVVLRRMTQSMLALILFTAVTLIQPGNGTFSGIADAKYADYPYVVSIHIKSFKFVGFMVSPQYIIAGIHLRSYETSDVSIYFGDPSAATAVIGQPTKMVLDEITVMKTYTPHAIKKFMTMAPSAFYNFAKDVNAKLIFFNFKNEFKYLNATARTDANCQTDFARLPADTVDVAFVGAKHICSEFDPNGHCLWTVNSDQRTSNYPALVVNGQPVGLYLEGNCDLFSLPMKWRSGIIFSEIAAHSNFIMKSAFLTKK